MINDQCPSTSLTFNRIQPAPPPTHPPTHHHHTHTQPSHCPCASICRPLTCTPCTWQPQRNKAPSALPSCLPCSTQSCAGPPLPGFWRAYTANGNRDTLRGEVQDIVGGFSGASQPRILVTGAPLRQGEGSSLLARDRLLQTFTKCVILNTLTFGAGHSLGGALAMLAAYDIAEAFPEAEVTVVTFGAPRVRPTASQPAAAAALVMRPLPRRLLARRCVSPASQPQRYVRHAAHLSVCLQPGAVCAAPRSGAVLSPPAGRPPPPPPGGGAPAGGGPGGGGAAAGGGARRLPARQRPGSRAARAHNRCPPQRARHSVRSGHLTSLPPAAKGPSMRRPALCLCCVRQQ